jgi:hypothetical protein
MMYKASVVVMCGARTLVRFSSNEEEDDSRMPLVGGDFGIIWGGEEEMLARRPKAEVVERKVLKEDWSSDEAI